jgi:hypothetical protein
MESIYLKSEFCLTPGQCYPVKTEVPIWLLLILFGSSYLILKEIYSSLK